MRSEENLLARFSTRITPFAFERIAPMIASMGCTPENLSRPTANRLQRTIRSLSSTAQATTASPSKWVMSSKTAATSSAERATGQRLKPTVLVRSHRVER